MPMPGGNLPWKVLGARRIRQVVVANVVVLNHPAAEVGDGRRRVAGASRMEQADAQGIAVDLVLGEQDVAWTR